MDAADPILDEDDLVTSASAGFPSATNNEDVYLGWPLYFPTTPFEQESPAAGLVEVFVDFFKVFKVFEKAQALSSLSENYSITLDFRYVRDHLPPEFVDTLQEQPESVLSCLGLALYQLVHNDHYEQNWQLQKLDRPLDPNRKISVHLMFYEPVTPLKSLKSHLINRFVAVRGTVIRVGNIKPLVVRMNFKCTRCNTVKTVFFHEGKYTAPTKCEGGCKSKTFQPERTTAVTVDWQKIKIQEQAGDDVKDSGRVPRTIEAELLDDLVDTCVPDDVVTVCGVVKTVSTDADSKFGSNKNKSLFYIYIDANSIKNNKQKNGKTDIMFLENNDLIAINAIAQEKYLFNLIVNSICPAIYGHEVVKAGLVLCLFGGVPRVQSGLTVRGDPHILVVGDPGMGKSQMLGAVANVAPRGVYVCGSYSSASGLTVTLLKEPGTGDYALEAGALVLGDQGCCCIDEFDKMANEHQSLLEAMEQQSISIAKAGIVCNLPARTSVIAAANPVGGHYNRAKTVSENLKMSAPILSRFDLVFILIDKPDQEMDRMLSQHVMSLHAGGKRVAVSRAGPVDNDDPDKPLSARLRYNPEGTDLIPAQLLRKYIAYAKKFVFPKLTEPAAKVLRDFYLTLRKKHRTADITPITTRQLEALVRLAEARAKLEMREEVTERDALDVVEIMKDTLLDSFEDGFGHIDFRRVNGMSKPQQARRFVAALTQISQRDLIQQWTMQQLFKVAEQVGIKVPNFEDFIDSLNQQNYLLKTGPGKFKLVTTSYR